VAESETSKKVTDAVDRYHSDRREKGFEGREGRDNRFRAESDLIKSINDIYPYDDWLKRHD